MTNAEGGRSYRGQALVAMVVALTTVASSQSPASAQVDTIPYSNSDRPLYRWHLEDAPLLDLGGARGPDETVFYRVAGVTKLPNGRFATADEFRFEIRIFDLAGSQVRSFGGEGEGPGEFSSLWEFTSSRGTLIATDRRGTAHFLEDDGSYVRSVPAARTDLGGRIRVSGYLGNGEPIGVFYDHPPDTRADETVHGNVVAIRDDGTALLVRAPGYERVFDRDWGEGFLVFGARMLVGVLHDTFCVGYGSSYSFSCYDSAGERRFVVVHRDRQSRRVSEADREAYLASLISSNLRQDDPAWQARLRRATRFADTFPAFGRFIGSTAGELWIGPLSVGEEASILRNPPPSQPTTWSVYSTEGVWLTEIQLPAGFRLREAGRDYVAGVATNEMGEETVRVYAIVGRP
jgi:hypothetical protein